jgi:hypothetical protein
MGSGSSNLRDDRSPIGCSHPRVSDGTRTRDVLDHNQVLYQLSYTHHAKGPNTFSWTTHRSVKCTGRRFAKPSQFGLGATPVSGFLMRSAISLDAALSGPGSGTNTASR